MFEKQCYCGLSENYCVHKLYIHLCTLLWERINVYAKLLWQK